MSQKILQIWIMPWAEFPELMTFGEIEIWDFYKEGPSRIKDTQAMLWLAQLVSCFRNRNGGELTNVAMIQNGQIPFSRQGQDGNFKIRWAGNAIAFAHLIGSIRNLLRQRNASDYSGNSERFQLKCVLIDSDGMVHYSEENAIGMSDVAGKYVLFHEPSQNILKLDTPDRTLLDGLASINDEHQNSALWRQLNVCFEWFAMAWTRSFDVSPPARFVSLMTAFESLVRQTPNDRAPQMAHYTEDLCGWDQLPKTETMTVRTRSIAISKPTRFIIDFAGYRNSFVHGDSLPWGLIRHCLQNQKFDPRQVMSIIIYCIVARLLLRAGAWKNPILQATVEYDLDATMKSLLWDTTDTIQESPHLSYPHN
ncbi:MAG: hypothetical protein K2X93_20910 [Candidatus Obscuribacterales bacterium]|nr:hypothetical protein [Candidatus Obscuribacterales bacterium]